MMKKVFKPFWSYDVEKTEEWLSTMALKGYHLVNINTLTRAFYFEEGTPQMIIYTVGFDKTYQTLSEALINDGWWEIVRHHNWYVFANKGSLNGIKLTPVREGIINHNKKVMYLFGGILLYMILSSLIPIFFSILFLFIDDATVTIVGSPMWIVTITVGIVMWSLTIYSTIKLYKTNHRLQVSKPIQSSRTSLSHKEEKRLKKSGDIIIKRRVAWFYSPDKLENWLEEMEAQGFNLYRINKFMGFFFKKGSPQKVSYCADYQYTTTDDYFEMHKEAGWKLMYNSTTFLSKWSIWAQTYEEGEVLPQLYSDREHMLKHARRVAITHLSLFVPILVMYIGVILLYIFTFSEADMEGIMWMSFIIYGLAIIEFSTFAVKSVLYYRRTKRKVEYTG